MDHTSHLDSAAKTGRHPTCAGRAPILGPDPDQTTRVPAPTTSGRCSHLETRRPLDLSGKTRDAQRLVSSTRLLRPAALADRLRRENQPDPAFPHFSNAGERHVKTRAAKAPRYDEEVALKTRDVPHAQPDGIHHPPSGLDFRGPEDAPFGSVDVYARRKRTPGSAAQVPIGHPALPARRHDR
jgi:hypothetical protein